MSAHDLFPASLPVLTGMRRTASGRAWLTGLPALAEELRERWDLRLGRPFHGGSCSWVAPALRADGTRTVLKVTWPHREARPEGAVLRRWAGRGAVRVHEHDPERYALLLERCDPGTELGRAGHLPAEERLLPGAGVLRTLWAAGEGTDAPAEVERLAEVAAERAGLVEDRAATHLWPGGPDPGLCAVAASLLRELPSGARRMTVVHGDFNPGNLLAARREPWLAIDAKPLYGDPAYDPWPLIQQIDDPFRRPDPRRTLAHRTALVADAAGADVARVRAWAVARQVEYALWTADRCADPPAGERLMAQARTLADVAGL